MVLLARVRDFLYADGAALLSRKDAKEGMTAIVAAQHCNFSRTFPFFFSFRCRWTRRRPRRRRCTNGRASATSSSSDDL